MAADSRVANEEGLIIDEKCQKISKIRGDIIGCEGNDSYITQFLEWYQQGRDPEKRPENIESGEFGAVVLTGEGRLIKYFAECYPIEHNSEFITLGSGGEIAVGAMAQGASPYEAVRTASQFNVWTGGEIVEERI